MRVRMIGLVCIRLSMLPYVVVAFHASLGRFMYDHKPRLTLASTYALQMAFLNMLHVFMDIGICDCVFVSKVTCNFMIDFNSNM